MTSLNNCRYLEWDSQHFGLRIASCRWEGEAALLPELLAKAKNDAIDVLYLFVPSGIELPERIRSEYTSLHRSSRVEFYKALESAQGANVTAQKNTVVLTKESAAPDRLRRLAILAGRYSRFLTDPRFPKEKGEDLFAIWAERSVAGELADIVFGVVGRSGELQGFIALRQEDKSARIGLIAVEADEQGKGWGSVLIESAETWAKARGLAQLRAATQADNIGACRFYLRRGFRKQDCFTVYHIWLS